MDFPNDLELISVAQRYRSGGPLSYAVHGQYYRLLKRRRKECAGGMALMVFSEQQPAAPITFRPNAFQLPAEKIFLKQLLPNP